MLFACLFVCLFFLPFFSFSSWEMGCPLMDDESLIVRICGNVKCGGDVMSSEKCKTIKHADDKVTFGLIGNYIEQACGSTIDYFSR